MQKNNYTRNKIMKKAMKEAVVMRTWILK
jgi:hypothetical protein